MTIQASYKGFISKLNSIYDERESQQITNWIFEKYTGHKHWQIRDGENILEKEVENKIDNALKDLLQHKPVQYILQEAWFYKNSFFVNEHVLIPRPETEELVEWVVRESENRKNKISGNIAYSIIDIGTGSGCIPIILKKHRVLWDVSAIEVSKEALDVAIKNAKLHNVIINFLPIDFLKEEQWKDLKAFDVIVSNPPYIPMKGKNELSKNVSMYEPAQALFVADDDPFQFYKKIIAFGENHLKSDGKIFVEVHEQFGREVKDLFINANYSTILTKDIYGKERMILAHR